ncbi:MAG: response regulator transcription factor [Roseivirga sp.]|nr:response regulator transcription factor [Roseivirga sp.]
MEERYKVLIVDDEEPARDLLLSYAKKMTQLEVVAVESNALDAKRRIDQGGVDILLTDIQMDDLTGIDLVKTLKHQPVTIFTTAYSEYALEGYELDVIDYLVKPISFQRFCRAIDKAIELIQFTKETPAENTEETKTTTAPKRSDFFFVKTNRKMVKVKYDEILFVESFGEYVKLHTENDVLLALQTTGFMEEMLPTEDFFRIHRSCIVNINRIEEVEGNMVKIEQHKLTISKRMRDSFISALAAKGII